MQKLRLWIAGHRTLGIFLLGPLLCAIYTWAFVQLSFSPVTIIVLDLFIFIVNYCYVDTIPTTIIKKPLEALEKQCDPYPMREMTAWLRTCKTGAVQEQFNLVNHCVALRELGEYQNALDLLSSLTIEIRPGVSTLVKMAYQNNLADICTLLGEFERGNDHYAKMMQYASLLKAPKQKSYFNALLMGAKAQNHFRNGEYDEVIQTLNAMQDLPGYSLSARVNDDLLCAQAYLKRNDTENAKSKLLSVIQRGNKLYAVTEARQLLATLTAVPSDNTAE